MTDEEFKNLVGKVSIRSMIFGVFMFLFGALILFALFTDNRDGTSKFEEFGLFGQIVVGLVGAACVIFGFGMFYKPLQTKSQIKNGKHKLLHAISSGDKAYILWFYAAVEKDKNGIEHHLVWALGQDKRQYGIDARDDKETIAILQYLIARFPNALKGETPENEKLYKQRLKQVSG